MFHHFSSNYVIISVDLYWNLNFPFKFLSLVELLKCRSINQNRINTFSVKGQLVNSLGFAGHIISVVTIQLHHCCTKTALDNT